MSIPFRQQSRFPAMAAIWIALSFLPSAAAAERMIVLDEGVRDRCSLAPAVAVLEDSTGALDIGDVASPAMNGRFVPLDAPVFNPGKTASVFWLRFTLAGTESSRAEWFLEIPRPFVASLRLATRDDDGDGWTWREAGDFSRKARPRFSGKRLVFPLPANLREPRTFYLRVENFISLTLPLEACTEAALLRRAMFRMLWFGVYSGIILALALYNLFLYRSLRDRSYLWYTGYIIPLAFYFHGANGLISEYVLTVSPAADVRFTLAFLGVSFVAGVMFSRAFLLTSRNAPRLDRLLRAAAMGTAVFVPLGFFLPFQLVTDGYSLMGAIVSALTVAAGAVCWRRGFAPARVYLIAWSLMIFCALNYDLALNGLRPFRVWAFYGFQVASALEAILLSFALAGRIKTMEREREAARERGSRFRELAVTDSLTGLYNARFFRGRIAQEVFVAYPDAPLSLLMLDVDEFKQINDTFGHPEGDRALSRLGGIIRACVRESDFPCRYGGEEFAVILPGTTLAEAWHIGERIRAAFEAEYPVPDAETLVSTVSAGVAEFSSGEGTHDFIRRADRALYHAKRLGKNRTVADSGEIPAGG